MNTPCRRFRKCLEAGSEATLPPELRSHSTGCAECAGFAARLGAVHAGLRAHHAGVEPDAGFAARVAVRLERDPASDLGLAALRLLPVTLLLLAVLAWISFRTDAPAVQGSGEDVLGWLVADSTADQP